MPRLKKQPNLRQQFREVVERANNIGINARLARGYLYYTDDFSRPNDPVDHKIWADEKNLPNFREAIEWAEQIAQERSEAINNLTKHQGLLKRMGVKIDDLDNSRWWFSYEMGLEHGYLPFLKSSYQELLLMAKHS